MDLKLTLLFSIKQGADVDMARLQEDITQLLIEGFTNAKYRMSQVANINGAISYFE